MNKPPRKPMKVAEWEGGIMSALRVLVLCMIVNVQW